MRASLERSSLLNKKIFNFICETFHFVRSKSASLRRFHYSCPKVGKVTDLKYIYLSDF